MEITKINPSDTIKISPRSWTVKTENGKKKGVIAGIVPLMQMSVGKIYEVTKLLKKYGLEKYRGNIFVSNTGQLYYPHDLGNIMFYNNQIKALGMCLVPDEYKKQLEYEKVVDTIRQTEIITVVDCIFAD